MFGRWEPPAIDQQGWGESGPLFPCSFPAGSPWTVSMSSPKTTSQGVSLEDSMPFQSLVTTPLPLPRQGGRGGDTSSALTHPSYCTSIVHPQPPMYATVNSSFIKPSLEDPNLSVPFFSCWDPQVQTETRSDSASASIVLLRDWAPGENKEKINKKCFCGFQQFWLFCFRSQTARCKIGTDKHNTFRISNERENAHKSCPETALR